jgi:hypothetical protein
MTKKQVLFHFSAADCEAVGIRLTRAKNAYKAAFFPHLANILELKVKDFCQSEVRLMSNCPKTDLLREQFFKTALNLSER